MSSKELEKLAWKAAEEALLACVATVLHVGGKLLIRAIFRL